MKEARSYWISLLLLVTAFCTTSLAGAEWVYGSAFDNDFHLVWSHLYAGMQFAGVLVGVLFVHEMGHFLAARYHKVSTSPPFFMPLWLGFLGIPSLGSVGAFIRQKEKAGTQRILFDIGIAGPLAGMVAALACLILGMMYLPPVDYLYAMHPDYQAFGSNYPSTFSTMKEGIVVMSTGDNLLFSLLGHLFADPARLPHPYEMQHYPILFAGYWALVFTSINLLPIGQLDGGHVIYGLFGEENHHSISLWAFLFFVCYAGLEVPQFPDMTTSETLLSTVGGNLLYLGFLVFILVKPLESWVTALIYALSIIGIQMGLRFFGIVQEGSSGWLSMAFLLGRLIGIRHPRAVIEEGLNPARKWLGYLAILIFIVCFTPQPLKILTAKEVRAISNNP
jgi:membrane-associated protease RseP (regulator of RpoE activity)